MEKRFIPPDEAARELATRLFDDFTRGYNALGQFRGMVATEIERAAPGPIQQPLRDIDKLISSAQDQLDQVVQEMRKLAPGTTFLTLGRKPHHLPGR